MNLLLDTHIALWAVTDSAELSGRARSSFEEAGYRSLAIDPEHAVAVESLSDHHRDPFDRMLVAQAIVESMFLVTHDALLGMYSERVLVV